MIRSRLLITLAVVWFSLVAARPATAGSPAEQLRAGIDRVLRILEDPALKGEEKTNGRRQAIRTATEQYFDWPQMAKRALGPHWQGRSESERQEFVNLFRGLLERAYISRIERYSGETIRYGAESVDGDWAVVRTTMLGKQGRDVAIDYRLVRQGDRWLVYDVLVDHVSLVSNYRTQFNQIIQALSYSALVEKIRAARQ